MRKKGNVIAIIQARMDSTRLPSKVMADIAGKPMLWHIIHRVRQMSSISGVVLATTYDPSDLPIADFATCESIAIYRGDKENVLDRYYQAASLHKATHIVRITADCPLLDPAISDDVVNFYLENDYDYVSNINPPTFPDGLDTEVFSFTALERTWRNARLKSDREHVTPYIIKHPEIFKIGNFIHSEDQSALRWTVDEPRDLEFVRQVYHYLGTDLFGMQQVLDVLRKHPQISELNAGIKRNEGF